MIRNDEDFEIARRNLCQLVEVLRVARTTHPPEEYALMSKPFLLQIQERQHDIIEYLMSPAQAPSAP